MITRTPEEVDAVVSKFHSPEIRERLAGILSRPYPLQTWRGNIKEDRWWAGGMAVVGLGVPLGVFLSPLAQSEFFTHAAWCWLAIWAGAFAFWFRPVNH